MTNPRKTPQADSGSAHADCEAIRTRDSAMACKYPAKYVIRNRYGLMEQRVCGVHRRSRVNRWGYVEVGHV